MSHLDTDSRPYMLGFGLVGLLLAFALGIVVANPNILGELRPPLAQAQNVRPYTLVIQAQDLPVAPSAVWHAWTYNGTVPAPTLRVQVGETLRVRVLNRLNLTHSIHTHLGNYEMKYDGSQANTITGIGSGAMIPPGGEYTYEFPATRAGIYFYHCHSSDQHPILTHILQGLYGAIIVEDPDAPRPDREFVIFMAEMGPFKTGSGAPFYIMNGLGIPGGEMGLEAVFKQGGLPAVAAEFNKSLPAFKAKVGETVRFHVVNIGDLYHSFHLHGLNLVSEQYFPSRVWPGNTIQLLPGAAETFSVTLTSPAVWLFHCHVVSHADAGMIGVFIVEA